MYQGLPDPFTLFKSGYCAIVFYLDTKLLIELFRFCFSGSFLEPLPGVSWSLSDWDKFNRFVFYLKTP